MTLSVSISLISLCVSLSVFWLTYRRGKIRMTKPVQVAFLFEGEKPKVFLRTLLYSTGKRGYVIESLYVKLKRGQAGHTFGFWGYGQRNELMAAGGLRVGEDGVAYNHHFLEIKDKSGFQFLSGEYAVSLYAKIVNHSSKLLGTVHVTLAQEYDSLMLNKDFGVLFTWDPDAGRYQPSASGRQAQYFMTAS